MAAILFLGFSLRFLVLCFVFAIASFWHYLRYNHTKADRLKLRPKAAEQVFAESIMGRMSQVDRGALQRRSLALEENVP